TVEVVAPRICRELGIAINFENAATVLIRSGACRHLNLARAASEFSVGRCDDHAHFVNEVGARVCRRGGADIVTTIADGNAIASRVQLRESSASEVAALNTWSGINKVEYVARRER